jgi:carboxyl-terminal processing protease
MARGEYLRLAHAARDTAGRPSCRTDHGRTVYGGGGIYPDVVLNAEDGAPVWLARLGEEEVITRWMNAWLAAHPDGLGTVDALAGTPVLPAGALADFRAFAQRNGLPVPEGAEIDARLQHELVPLLAGTKWGAAGYYRLSAVLDAQVRQGVAQFPRATQILAGQ